MSELVKAIINVMSAVNGVDKGLTVGSGSYSYKGVADKDVKDAYKNAMAENGLCILPTEINETTDIHRWEYDGRQKISVFTKVSTKYLLMHTSGESQVISGCGHGIDSGDKSVGKATTYAMKYALLYTFMTPTGKIDDSDSAHSEEIKTASVPTKDEVIKLIGEAKTKSDLTRIKAWVLHYGLMEIAKTKSKIIG